MWGSRSYSHQRAGSHCLTGISTQRELQPRMTVDPTTRLSARGKTSWESINEVFPRAFKKYCFLGFLNSNRTKLSDIHDSLIHKRSHSQAHLVTLQFNQRFVKLYNFTFASPDSLHNCYNFPRRLHSSRSCNGRIYNQWEATFFNMKVNIEQS